MFKSKLNLAALAALVTTAVFVIGCGDNDAGTKKKDPGVMSQIVDSIAVAVSNGLAESTVNAVSSTDTEDISEEARTCYGPIGRMIRTSDKLYAVCPEGLLIYDFAGRKHNLVPAEGELRAVVEHAGSIYAGGVNLYCLVDDKLEKQPEQFEGVINALGSYEHRLMVGTTTGLYSTGIFGQESLMENVDVTAMTADGGGLWVGTSGQGLYRWNGVDFQKRFLRRDTSLFDYITALEFSHNHLYAASPNGLHIFNGGSWTTYTETEGLPSLDIRDIDASDWVVYIGTGVGVVSLYNDLIEPVGGLESQAVNGLMHKGTSLIFSTDESGVIRQNGAAQIELIPPAPGPQTDLLLTAG